MPEKSTVPAACDACGQWLLPRGPLKSLPLHVRVWWYIDRRPGDACWLWVGSLDVRGYGQIRDEHGRVRKAHQVVLETVLGRPLEPGEWGLHHCDVPACCNPAHLYAGSAADNSRDMWARGRGVTPATARGQANANSVLTDAQVATIVSEASVGGRGTHARLARQYSVSPSLISKIMRGELRSSLTAIDPNAPGVRNPAARLTPDQVIAIRMRYAAGGESMAALGREYGVTRLTIRLVVRRLTWKHVV